MFRVFFLLKFSIFSSVIFNNLRFLSYYKAVLSNHADFYHKHQLQAYKPEMSCTIFSILLISFSFRIFAPPLSFSLSISLDESWQNFSIVCPIFDMGGIFLMLCSLWRFQMFITLRYFKNRTEMYLSRR